MSAVQIPSATTDRLCQAARAAGIDVVIGIAEIDPATRGTVYCTLLFVGREGKILGRHRKLKPTDLERRVWGEGDGSGLTVYEREYGRISGLNCWEHNMVLPGYALMAQGTQVHVAAWPITAELDPSVGSGVLLSRAFATQGSCFVIASCAPWPDDVPSDYRDSVLEWKNVYGDRKGGCCIIAPGGEVIAKAETDKETILTASISLEAVRRAKGLVDVGGHYSRPDVLRLLVNRNPNPRIMEVDSHNEWTSGSSRGLSPAT